MERSIDGEYQYVKTSPMPKTNFVKLCISLPREVAEWLKSQRRKTGVPVSRIIMNALKRK